MSTQIKTATHLIYCDCCNDLVQKGEEYVTVEGAGGKLWCLTCWETAK